MDFHLLSDVRQTDGGRLGELRHIIFDTETEQVVSIVVQPADMAAQAVVVPIGAVDSADDNGVYLSLYQDQFDDLEEYASARNVAPPPADLDPETESADLDEGEFDVPDVPPVGAATGITSIAFTPILQVSRNVPPRSIIIDDHTLVQASDGQLGRVDHVLVNDQTKRIDGLVAGRGGWFSYDAQIPLQWVSRIQSGIVTLNVDRATVQGANQ